MSKGYSGLFSGTKGAMLAVPGEAVFESYVLTPQGVKDYSYFKNIAKRSDVDANGIYDVVAHGLPDKIQIEHNGVNMLIDSRTLAHLLKIDNRYGRKQSIRLLSCNTGTDINGFAQNLANKLNVTVYAPTNIVWAYPSGRHIVAPRLSNDPSSPLYKYPDERKSKRGKFIPFTPGGNKNGR